MSSAPTDCRVPDPTDAKADGNFGNHRAGYGSDRLRRAEAWARKGYTLAAGEGLVLVQEIDRLRSRKIDREDLPSALLEENKRLREQLRDTHTEVFHLGEKLSFVERERDQLTSLPAERILAALREPLGTEIEAAAWDAYRNSAWPMKAAIHAAVAAAEREVANGHV